MPRTPTDAEYARLLAFRTELRRFQRLSEQRAAELGLTASQHQLLLAVRGHHDKRGPTISDVADYLLVRHHTVVGLVDRTQGAGLVERRTDPHDHRLVRLTLTAAGEQMLAALSQAHLEELARMGPALVNLSQMSDQ